jgi:zinc transporter
LIACALCASTKGKGAHINTLSKGIQAMALPFPTPICAYSVSEPGLCKPTQLSENDGIVAPASGYLWFHFDLNDPDFAAWAQATMPAVVADALLQSETRPRCDALEDGLIVNLRGVNLNPGADPDDMVSIRLWVADKIIISARVRKLWAVDTIRLQMEKGTGPRSIPAFLADLTYGLTKRIEKVSLKLAETTDELEERALHPDRTAALDLALLRQSVIKLRRFVRPQKEAIADLASSTQVAHDSQNATRLSEIANRTTRTVEELASTSERLQAFQDHLDILHSASLGRNSYVLSVVAAIFLPLGFLTGLFGINVGGMPGVDAIYGFWIVTGGSALLGIVLFLVFRHLKWL